MKCFECGKVMKDGECECGNKTAAKKKSEYSTNLYGTCSICGNNRGHGKNISTITEKPIYYCYKCYLERPQRAFHLKIKSFDTKSEARYNRAIHEYILEPLFHDKEPDYEKLSDTYDNVLDEVYDCKPVRIKPEVTPDIRQVRNSVSVV